MINFDITSKQGEAFRLITLQPWSYRIRSQTNGSALNNPGSDGVMECWSNEQNGMVSNLDKVFPILQCSNTPLLLYRFNSIHVNGV